MTITTEAPHLAATEEAITEIAQAGATDAPAG